MVNDFHGDAACFRFGEGAAEVAVEAAPGFLVDLCFEGGAQGFVGIALAEEVGVADEEAFFVVVGIDEPTRNALRSAAFDFAGLGFKDDYAQDGDLGKVAGA